MTSKMTFIENGAINERAFTKENIGEAIYQIDVKDPISVTKSSPSERLPEDSRIDEEGTKEDEDSWGDTLEFEEEEW